MTPIDVVIELLGRVGASQGHPVLINEEELLGWPGAAVKALKSQKLILKAHAATSAVCPGCEENCVMPVHTIGGGTDKQCSFIVCDKRDDTNRVPVTPESLIQWQSNADLVCDFVASGLGLRLPKRQMDSAGRREIGFVRGENRSQMLCLETSGVLILVVGSGKIPLAELIEFHETAFKIDAMPLQQFADFATTADDRYTPSTVRREARKLDTQAMHESWRKAYRALQKKRPGMSDVWYSQQIAKNDIAKGHDSETIRKRMKR